MDMSKADVISEYIERMYPNISRSMKEDIAKDMMGGVSDVGMHNLKYSMDQDDGFLDEQEHANQP